MPNHKPPIHQPSLSGIFSCRRTAVQGVLRPRCGTVRETQTTTHSHHIHVGPAEGAGASLPRDALSGHLHARGDRHEDRFDRSTCAGEPHSFFFSIYNVISSHWDTDVCERYMACVQPQLIWPDAFITKCGRPFAHNVSIYTYFLYMWRVEKFNWAHIFQPNRARGPNTNMCEKHISHLWRGRTSSSCEQYGKTIFSDEWKCGRKQYAMVEIAAHSVHISIKIVGLGCG